MRGRAALLLGLAGVRAWGATAYVSDELVLNVVAEPSAQGQRLVTLHSGAVLETSSVEGEYTQVRLADGVTGWVKTSYLTNKEPAVVRVKKLEEELARSRSSPAGQSEAAARNELEQLRRTLDTTQQELKAARAQATPVVAAAHPPAPAPVAVGRDGHGWLTGVLVLLAGGLGFWLGYATLARRVRTRFGGIKVY